MPEKKMTRAEFIKMLKKEKKRTGVRSNVKPSPNIVGRKRT